MISDWQKVGPPNSSQYLLWIVKLIVTSGYNMSGDITVAHVSNYTPMDNTTAGPTGSWYIFTQP